MGTATVAVTNRGVSGNRRWVEGTITMSSTYASNGETITVNDFEASVILAIRLASRSTHFSYKADLTNNKIIAYEEVSTTGSTTAADSTTGALAEDAAGIEGAIRLMGSVVDTTYRFGTAAEVSANHDLSSEIIDFEATILA